MHADGSCEIEGINTLAHADANQISFLANNKYHQQFVSTKAKAVIVSKAFAETLDPHQQVGLLVVAYDPYLAFAKVQRLFHPQDVGCGILHPTAIIDASAQLADTVDVGAKSVIEADVLIGEGTVIAAGVVVEAGAKIGKRCILHAGAVVSTMSVLGNDVILQSGAVIGSDGFGYAWSGSEHLKIPQVGRVILEDGVEVGANSCVDRGVLGDTIIRRGVKLDNLIQIAHNVEVGAFTVMASQVGISGSTTIGQGCQIGGQTGMAGHLKVGDGCKLAAKTGVTSDLEAGKTYAGFPAMPHHAWLKMSVLMMKLPEIWKKIKSK